MRSNVPGHQLQVDVKFIEPLGQKGRKKRYYQYTAIDDCTRLRVLRAYPRNDQKTAIAFIDHVLSSSRSPSTRSRPTTAGRRHEPALVAAGQDPVQALSGVCTRPHPRAVVASHHLAIASLRSAQVVGCGFGALS